MKILTSILFFIIAMTLVTSCGDSVKAEIKLNSMQCGMCSNTIKTTLKDMDGIEKVSVDMDKKIGYVVYNAEILDLAKIENAIASAGYDANDTKANADAYSKLNACCKLPGK